MTEKDELEAMAPSAPKQPWYAGSSISGQLLILCVALLWGTNPPAIRYLYTSEGIQLNLISTRNFASVERVVIRYIGNDASTVIRDACIIYSLFDHQNEL